MQSKKIDRRMIHICRLIVQCLFLINLSAIADEELTLDTEDPPKLNSNSAQNETKDKVPNPSSQVDSNKEIQAYKINSLNYSKLFREKKYKQLTDILWSHIDSLKERDLVLLTKAHYLNKDFFETIKAGNLVLAKNSKNYEALTYMGLANLRKKKDREAKEYLKHATDISPTHSPAINGLVEIYEKSGNFYELRLIYSDLVKRYGENPEYYNRLCDIDTRDGIADSAITYCKKAIVLSPNIPENYSNLGIVYRNINDAEKAEYNLKLAVDKFPKSDIALMTYAQFLEDQKNYIDSFKHYSQCVKVNDFSEKCWIGYASTSYQIQKFSETILGLKKACQFNRKHLFIGRKAAAFARSVKQSDWAKKIDSVAEMCGN